jgi:hypothetical protein
MDGDDFRQVAFDPDLGEVRTGEPDPQYYVDHARFVGLKRTLLRLRRLDDEVVSKCLKMFLGDCGV